MRQATSAAWICITWIATLAWFEYSTKRFPSLLFTTIGLAMSFNTLKSVFPFRIFIVDNSSSMNQRDGHRIVNNFNDSSQVRMEPCTRWEELHDSIKYHINLAGLLHAPTKFRVRTIQRCSLWCLYVDF